MKVSSMIGVLLCSAGIAISQDAVELPLGKTNLLDIGWFDLGYQSYGKEEHLLPKGTVEDMMGETGIANKPCFDNGRYALLLHSPWRIPTGRTWIDYTLKFPQTDKIDFRFSYAMREGMVGQDKSDGVEFFCFIFGEGEEPRKILDDYYLGSKWKDVSVDLSQYAGKKCTIRFQVEPGPNKNPNFDYSLFSDMFVQVGEKTEANMVEQLDNLLKDKAIQAQMQTPMTALLNRSGQGITPSNRFPYTNKLERVDGGWNFVYEGPDCKMVYSYRPESGQLDDFFLSYNGLEAFPIAAHGGLKLGGNKVWSGKATFIRQKQDGNRLIVAINYNLPDGDVETEWAFELIGKALAIEVMCESQAIRGLELGTGGLKKLCKHYSVPYLHMDLDYMPENHLYSFRRIDWTKSDASTAFKGSSYDAKNDGSRNPLHDFAYIAFSPDPSEVLPNIPWEPSKYRKLLGPKIMLDFWGSPTGSFADDGANLRLLKDMGVDHAAIIYHSWQRFGYDVKLPDHIPANPNLGGDDAMIEFGKAANDCGYVWSLHENYIDLYPDAPSFDEKSVVIANDGKWSKAWYNGGTKVQSYGLKCNHALKYAKMNAPEIHRRYKTTAAYLDVHTCVSPSHQLDHDATQPMAANARFKVLRDSELFDYMRKTHEGPLFGEGGGHIHWAGACDGTEAQVRGGCLHKPYLDFDLLKLHPQMVNHGMGYYERWNPRGYSLSWGYDAGSQDRIDMYRAQEIAYGHAGFVSGNQCFNTSWVVREHNLVHAAQELYGDADVQSIQYEVCGKLVPASVALALDCTERQLITYDNGTIVLVNWGAEPWTFTEDGASVVIPQWGVVVNGWKNGTKVRSAFEARPGVFADYVECPEYVFADARTSFDMPYLKQTGPVASVRVKDFKYLGGNEIEVSYEWTALRPTEKPTTAFIHFLNKQGGNDRIIFQNDHALSKPSSEWKAGETFVCGPHKITIPQVDQYSYDWVAGLYNKGGRQVMDGVRFDSGRYLLGKLTVERNKQNNVTNVVFEPVSAERVADAKEGHLDFTKRVNPKGTMITFDGKIKTDGSVKIQKTADGAIIFPYPRDKEFTIMIDTRKVFDLGNPSDWKLVAKAALTQEDMGEIPVTVDGDWLVFKAGLKGAGRYLLIKK
ncbi:MAG: hypothetical protein IKZ46_04860 [Victivallales bacterium]|nr:hypothetical protein [Victivallales bacterium]